MSNFKIYNDSDSINSLFSTSKPNLSLSYVMDVIINLFSSNGYIIDSDFHFRSITLSSDNDYCFISCVAKCADSTGDLCYVELFFDLFETCNRGFRVYRFSSIE